MVPNCKDSWNLIILTRSVPATDLLQCKGPENILLNFLVNRCRSFWNPPVRNQRLCRNSRKVGRTSAENCRLAAEEEDIFKPTVSQPYLALPTRKSGIIDKALANQLPQLIQPCDIKGIIHSHSNWSDGTHTLEEMAIAAKERGWNTW